MAAAAVFATQAVDLTAPASYTIRLGTSITKPVGTLRQYTSIRYNHKPQLKGTKDVTATIRAGKGSESKLKVQDYSYNGEVVGTGDSYVLVVREYGKDKEAVLEKLGSAYVYNLVGTPDAGSGQLAKRYPHISIDEADVDELGGGEDEAEDEPDSSNPFDYRHFLRSAVAERVSRPVQEVLRSTVGTPIVHSRAVTATPVSRPAKREVGGALVQQRKRKAPAAVEKPNAKRAKAGQESAPLKAQPNAKPDAPPKIRVDRKASLRRPSYDDSGELILENETPVSDKMPGRQSAMSLALSGQLLQGPISLHSAANSPASQIASPMALRPTGMDDSEGEFELGGSSPEESGGGRPAQHVVREEEDDDADEEEDDDDDVDADVEDLELPSPATEHRPSVSAATVTAADEDDLDAQLAAAMAEEEGEAVIEEEESEEE